VKAGLFAPGTWFSIEISAAITSGSTDRGAFILVTSMVRLRAIESSQVDTGPCGRRSCRRAETRAKVSWATFRDRRLADDGQGESEDAS